MNKKKIFIFASLSILAVICAFGIVSFFAPKGDNYLDNLTEIEYSQDFIEVDNYLIDEEIKNIENTEDIENIENTENTDLLENDNIGNTEQLEIKKENDIPISSQTFEKIETESWENYLEAAEENGYDFSDISNEVLSNYENTLNNPKKVSEGELSFLNNLMILADNYTAVYEEVLSYLFSADKEKLKEYLDSDYSKTIENFKSLDCLGVREFEMIKEDYLNGMLSQQKGFYIYLEKPESEDMNPLFVQSDNDFYNAQMKLTQLLDSYK